MQKEMLYIPDENIDEELTIDLKKILLTIWSQKYLIVQVFLVVFLIFIALTFVLPKKYTVNADLYINKTNNTNLAEFNPFIIDSQLNGSFSLTGTNKLADELEIINSPIVMENVILENNIKYKKLFGIFTTKKTGKFVSPQKFNKKRKNPKIENVKNTNILKISYTSKDPKLAYDVVNSIINNYIVFQQSLNAEKSKSDKAIIEEEYNKVKSRLKQNINQSAGLPENALYGMGSMSAMSAFSTSASKAMAGLKGQMISGKRTQIEVSEDAAKTAALSSKLEWAKIVEKMSDTSTVLLINPPLLPEKYEQSSPKLLTNILLGLFFGFLFSLIALIISENRSKKLTYSMLGDNIIYDFDKDLLKLQIDLLSEENNNIAVICFDNTQNHLLQTNFNKYHIIQAGISNEFINSIKNFNKFLLFSKIAQTDSTLYKQVNSILKNLNKEVISDVLVKD